MAWVGRTWKPLKIASRDCGEICRNRVTAPRTTAIQTSRAGVKSALPRADAETFGE